MYKLYASYKETSPLTRGRPVKGIRFAGGLGNIPAYAGETPTFCVSVLLLAQNIGRKFTYLVGIFIKGNP